jgi:hypothetical protein
MRLLRVVCVAAAMASLAGCGVADPYARRAAPAAQAAAAPEQAARAPRPVAVAPARPATFPRATAGAFAEATTNWAWRTLARSQRVREQLAAPTLRRQIALDAAAARAGRALARDHHAERGVVLAIDVQGSRARRVAYIVTRETTTNDGVEAIGDETIAVYRAALVQTRRGWLVASWAPVE